MRRWSFFVLAMMVLWIAMLLWTFFGWKSKDKWDDIKQSLWTWFMLQIMNTRDFSRLNSEKLYKKQNLTVGSGNEIVMVMPKYFYNSERENFAKDLYDGRKIYLKFTFVDDLNLYEKDLSENKFPEADLFLFPYDWIEKIPTRGFSIQDEIYSKFDQIVQPLVKWKRFPFLPFAADPMVVYAVSWYSSQNNFYEISEFVSNREIKIPLSFPLFFGMVGEDLDDRWFVWEYQDIIRYALMHYFTVYKDENDLWTWIDSNVTQKYNAENLDKILNIITVPECKYFPSICFQVYKFVWLRFWFLSDADIVDIYFSWKKSKFDDLSKLTVPFFKVESPVRIRWWGMSSSLEDYKIDSINEFMEQYLDKYNEYDLRNSTLPVFKSEDGWLWLLNNKYIWLKWYILTSGWNYVSMLKNISIFWDLLNYKITAEEYLRYYL